MIYFRCLSEQKWLILVFIHRNMFHEIDTTVHTFVVDAFSNHGEKPGKSAN